MRLLDGIRKALDPIGPLGAVLSPADVYKERAGLPTQSPHVARARLEQNAFTDKVIAAQPARFVSIEDAVDVPASRERQISAYVTESWAPVYAKTDSTDLATILISSQKLIGWQVTQRESQQSRQAKKAAYNAEHFAEIAVRAQIQASDEFYAQYYETIPGNDVAIIDGEILRAKDGTPIRGGTQINSRKEYEAKTKGMIHWDRTHIEQRNAALAELDSRPVRNVAANLERVKGESLPMRRLIPNGRYDRGSAV